MAIVLKGDSFIEIRLSPYSKKNRAKLDTKKRYIGRDGNIDIFISNLLNDKDSIFSKNQVKRKNNINSCLSLAYVFWRVSNDKYVNNGIVLWP